MSKAAPVLMENTETGLVVPYRAKTCTRLKKLMRPIYLSDATPAQVKDFCLKPEAAKPAPAPTGDVPSGCPDLADWDEAELREYTQEHDIPVHPNAKAPGLTKSIQTFHSAE